MATQSLRSEFHTELANALVDDIRLLNSTYYYFLGKVDAWGTSDIPGTTPHINSPQIDFSLRSNALYFRKISHNDVTLATTRYNWNTGAVFDKWDHTIDMNGKQFYCMTDEFNVYKCLDNKSGAQSTSKPTGQSFGHIKTPDGYTWKFMYNIPPFKRTKFLSLTNMPVQTAISDSFYDRGAIERVLVTNGGSGYSDVQMTYIAVDNTVASGTGASFGLTVHPLTGTIQSVTVINGGSGYSAGCDVRVTTTTFGVGSELFPIIVGGVIQSVTVVNGGVGYSTSDTVFAVIGGAILVPQISRTTGEILDVTIVDAGSGYSTAPALTVGVAPGAVAGAGAFGNPTALMSAIVVDGKIVRVVIQDPGKDYPTDFATTIAVAGDGEGAVLTPVVYNGELVSVIVEDAGIGYTFIQTVVYGSGSGATLKPITSTSDFQSNQSIVEQTAVPGAIYAIQLTNGGTNYSIGTTVSIVGDGVGCTAHLEMVNGVITEVVVDSVGSGYSTATVVFNDPLRPVAPLGSVDASAYIILPPHRGHGRDAVSELNGRKVAIASTMKKEHGMEKFQTEQEYRQYGILKNPSYLNSGRKFKLEANLVVYVIGLDGVFGLIEDEILVSNGIRYRVVSIDQAETTVTIQRLTDRNAPIDSLVAETDTSRSYLVKNILSAPLLDKYSGKLLYISDEVPFIITDEQNILVKTTITL